MVVRSRCWPTLRFIEEKFAAKPEIAEANRRALQVGWNYGETTEGFASTYQVPPAKLPPGQYCNIMGNEAALVWGLIAASSLSGKPLVFGLVSDHARQRYFARAGRFKNFGVRTFQAEDEIAAVCSAIGAAFGGAMAVTASSGPGIALKSEGDRPGGDDRTAADDYQYATGWAQHWACRRKPNKPICCKAIYGRNGECPMPVIAARSPGDCFDTVIEAWRVATRYMTPIYVLSDGYIANGAEPWRIPLVTRTTETRDLHPGPHNNGEPYMPYERDEQLSRPWALPGTAGLMHRIGGLEKEDITGNVSYDPKNHQHMVNTRAKKMANIANDHSAHRSRRADAGVLVLSWGGTYGACRTAVHQVRREGAMRSPTSICDA